MPDSLTSAVQRRHDSFPEVSRTSKIPANKHIISEAVFSRFQDIHLGCCTQSRSAGLVPITLVLPANGQSSTHETLREGPSSPQKFSGSTAGLRSLAAGI